MAATFEPRAMITKFVQDNTTVNAFQFILNNPDGVEIKDIVGSGMVNYVYRVSSEDKKESVIIKYGEEQMRMFPTEKVPMERQKLEFDCLKLLHSIQPGSVPEAYCLDRNHNAMAMQDMKGWDLLGDQLKKQHIDLQAATNLGELLAKIHKETTKEALGAEKWQELVKKFSQEEARRYLSDFTYSRPFDETASVNIIPEEHLETYRSYVKQAQTRDYVKKMIDQFEKEECFIHADCHWNSIFVNPGKAMLFDFEYAFLSNPAANLSYCLVGYLFFYQIEKNSDANHIADKPKSDIPALKVAYAQGARHVVEGYLNVRPDISSDQSRKEKFLSDVALYAGGTTFMVGIFSFLNIFCEPTTPVRIGVNDAGFKLLMRHEDVKTVDQLLNAMFDE